jgi:hypothetical protein
MFTASSPISTSQPFSRPHAAASVSYTVHIKQLATDIIRTRQENSAWSSDERLWSRGSRACDCARALLFAQDGETVASPCGVSAYAIRVTAADGEELYGEPGFEESETLLDFEDVQPVSGDAGDVVGWRIGLLARQAFDRFAGQVSYYAAHPDMLVGRHDPR